MIASAAVNAAVIPDAIDPGFLVGIPIVSPVLHRLGRGGYRGGVGNPSAIPVPIPAGLGRRVIAIIIDWVASLLVVRLIFPGLEYPSNDSAVAILGIFYLEVVLFTWLIGSSFGQRIVGIAVIRNAGGRLGLPAISLRTFLICLVIPALVYDSDGRGLQDRAAGTRVVLRSSVTG